MMMMMMMKMTRRTSTTTRISYYGRVPNSIVPSRWNLSFFIRIFVMVNVMGLVLVDGVEMTGTTSPPTTTSSGSTSEFSSSSSSPSSYDIAFQLKQWVETTKGGYIHPSVGLVYNTPTTTSTITATTTTTLKNVTTLTTNNESNGRWVLGTTTNVLRKGEVVAIIPSSIVLKNKQQQPSSSSSSPFTSNEKDNGDDLSCSMIKTILKELELGIHSHFLPLLNHLKEMTLDLYPIPSLWNDSGRQLLRRLLHDHDDDDDGDHKNTNKEEDESSSSSSIKSPLPPKYPTEWITHDYLQFCTLASFSSKGRQQQRSQQKQEQEQTKLGPIAAAMTVSWVEDSMIIPLSSLLLHRNGQYTNVEMVKAIQRITKDDDDDNDDHSSSVTAIVALRDIEVGEVLTWSHNLCKDCQRRRQHGYGTAGTSLQIFPKK